LPAQRLRRAILVAATTKQRWVFVVGDDALEPTSSRRERTARIAVMATLEEIEEALTNVIDPELGLDFVELGLIYGIQQDAGNVHVTFTLTTPACPIGPQITEQIEEFVAPLEGVNSVKSSMVFDPPWSPEKMSEDAKFALGF
jgi:metal-sulfur cluster biosynthetic enzyme